VKPVDVVTGFLNAEEGEAQGRPVGVIVDKATGGLPWRTVCGNVVWKVHAAQ
jgi:glucose/arabinose dehydrogenase